MVDGTKGSGKESGNYGMPGSLLPTLKMILPYVEDETERFGQGHFPKAS